MTFKYLFNIGKVSFFYKNCKTIWWQKDGNKHRTDFLFGLHRVFERENREYIYKLYCGRHCLLWIKFR